jgi:replicative DNA helicase
MIKKFGFDRDFQIGILALITQNYEFLLTSIDLVQPDYFEDAELVWVFQAMKNYFIDYQQRPTRTVLLNELNKALNTGRVKAQNADGYRNVIENLDRVVDAQDYVIAEVVRFCRRQEVRKAMLELAPLTDKEDDTVWEQITDRMQKACNTGQHVIDIGTQYFLEYPERLKRRIMGEEQLAIPTGITELDYKIGGGLKAGQLGIWLGGTGTGKSIALPHCGKRAIIGGWKVVHYTLELNEDDIAQRYDAAWSHVPVHELLNQTAIVEREMEKLYAKYKNSLIIKFYPTGSATVNTIKQHLLSLRNFGFVPDLIIVDYGDLLKPLTSYADAYADLGAIFRDLRGIAGEMKVPLWTATQMNRGGMSLEVADLDVIADSFQKAFIADVVIALCANREELENNTMRLFGAKNRNGPSKFIVPIRTAYDQMVFHRPTAMPPQVIQPPAQPPPVMPRRRAPKGQP